MSEQVGRHIVAHSKPEAYRGDGDVDYLYLPTRSLGGIERVKGGLFILPEYPEVQTYAQQLDAIRAHLQIRGPTELSPVYVPPTDEILDVAILAHLDLLRSHLTYGQKHILSPYSHTKENETWMEELRKKGYVIESDIALKQEDLNHHDNRGGWGNHVWDPHFVPVPVQAGIPYPSSWIGRTQREVVEAYQRVVYETGNPKVQFKGVHSAGGFVNKTAHSIHEVAYWYEQFEQQGALGISGAVEIQAYIEKLGRILSFQYSTLQNGTHIIDTPGFISEQILLDSNWQGNRFNDPTLVAKHQSDVAEMFARLIPVLNGSQAKGGFDIGETPNGLVVIEHNAKRITGGHPGIALMQAFQVPSEMPAVTKKCPQTIACDVTTLWNVLLAEGVAFDPVKKQGIFPVCWMNKHYGMLMAFGPVQDTAILEGKIDAVYNTLSKQGYLTT